VFVARNCLPLSAKGELDLVDMMAGRWHSSKYEQEQFAMT
jgi:hypothetical protein